MSATNYLRRRNEIEEYFDRTAADAWARLTSDEPLTGVRATVRAGRDNMRATLMSWLPQDLQGARVLDAGCGAGQLAMEAAARGADVVAIDLSKSLVDLAAERAQNLPLKGSVDFRVGDMLNPPGGPFDYVVCMDSVIHYDMQDFQSTLYRLISLSTQSCSFTFAPSTPLLSVMHAVGKLFPRGDRSPAIKPHSEQSVYKALSDYRILNSKRIKSGFYISHAVEVSG
ncbi:MAG: magnesium protoporphyrin IX methyltransferase [Hyphomonadaceae bacterium]|nr:magnesium protoporphyrin IX methyltransferase [Hyphomonadaceae bacterium]